MLRISYLWNERIADSRFHYAVMVARQGPQWIFVRQAARQTFELPAGRREPGESILQTARRELYEETGATCYKLAALCPFMVFDDNMPVVGETPCGMLYLAEIQKRAALPQGSEIAETVLLDQLPANLSYPEVQPRQFRQATLLFPERIRLPDHY